MTNYRVAVDIGGTFTDIVIEDSQGSVRLGKIPTTPENPAQGVIEGIKKFVDEPTNIEFFVHGTTVGLNAFLQRRGERVLLIMSEGISDTYTIARGPRLNLYQLQYQKPEQLVPRSDVFEVSERVSWDGEVLKPLRNTDFDEVIEIARREKVKAVAVCFLHAYAYPEHELQARELLQQALPGVSISLSHDVAKEWREYERASSTVMNAYIAPVVERYLASLKHELAEIEVDSEVHIMQSSGGVMKASVAEEKPVYTLLSGPVGGTIAGAALAKSSARPNLLCVDMGGTSFDLSLVVDGKASTTLETTLEGLPLLMSIVDIQTIGTGGGSIAWSEAKSMRVGPHSAGSVPGPVCYGRGGTEPTVTDANFFLGRLGAASLLSGDMELSTQVTREAIEKKAAELDMDPVAYAEGILQISNAAMADAMRTITVKQGIDPREFSLVAFGGAGPMAAVFLAAELDIDEVIVPRFPGTFSAWGMLQTDLRHDLSRPFFFGASEVTEASLNGTLKNIEAEAQSLLEKDLSEDNEVSFHWSADMRYVGQEFSINVPVAVNADVAAIIDRFHHSHEQRHGHATRDNPVEFVNLRVTAFGAIDKYENSFKPADGTKDAQIGRRKAIFGGESHETIVLQRDYLVPGDTYHGPLVIEEQSATSIVPPGCEIQLDTLGNVIVRLNKNES
ncbi:MAG: hydantoinase/oxoprolinase family protein [Gammaproteobacteria bacterium]|nr:hydantoinase/oxoprolinase family protein [Gammaproteobacteria bacterium]